MATLEFEGVSKVYEGSVAAVRDLTLAVDDGEFVVLVGPSGCGKTTALRMLAGLEQITAGEIRIGGERVNDVPPRDRDIAMVFQNYALYPHMNVGDNLAYGLRVRRVPRAERRNRVEHVAAILGLTEHLNRKPSQLSGGQRQRVAMGRAIVREPQAFLMDEPLSNLDARLRVQMRTEIAGIQRDLRVTTVYVTHDQVEAMTMADRVAVMRSGILQQLDTPQRVYGYPANLFVATFMGSPAMNILEGQLGPAAPGGIECRIGSYAFPVEDSILGDQARIAGSVARTIAVGIRPEAISVVPDGSDALRGTVVLSEDLGSEVMVHIEVEATSVKRDGIAEDLGDEPAPGGAVTIGARTGSAMVVARLPAEAPARRGAPIALTFDVNRIHFFDLQDGHALRPYPGSGSASTPVQLSR